MQIILTKYYLY